MESSPDERHWQQFAHPGFRVRFRYPAVTPQGQTVERAEEYRDGAMHAVHLTAGAKRELYFEVIRFPDLTPQDEYTRHRAHLEQRFGAGTTTTLTETRLGRRPAWAYAFRRDQGERAVLLLQVDGDTYRIIYDPRTLLNAQILATITIVE